MNKPGRAVQAAAGHLRDLYRLARFEVFNPHSYSKYRTIRAVQKRTGATELVETGTFMGVTTNRCAAHFERVYTIELDHDLATGAAEFLRSRRNVTVIEGDAAREVEQLFRRGRLSNSMVFLDGHFSGAGTSSGDVPEPAVDLLRQLAKHGAAIRAIVVDDFREFGHAPGWPKKWELFRVAEELFVPLGFRLAVHLDQVLLERLAD